MLTQLCRHVVNAPRLAQLVTATLAKRKLNVSAYNTPLKMQERESRCIASLSTKLRITQQATVSPKTKKPSVINVPWQDSPFWCWRALAG